MLKGLYFPGLRPDAVWTGALLPLLGQLVVYGVVEDEPVAGDVPTPWEVRVVAPLGGDRSRFLSLLREMTGREAESFRGQMLALASRPGRDRDEASVGNLAGVLHRLGEGKVAIDQEKARVERIWQARLFLKLVELVTAAESEVELGLAAMASCQAEMLKALQGDEAEEEADEFPPAAPLLQPPPRKSFRTRDRLAAWAVFYLLDSRADALLLTDDPEALALLSEEVEKLAPGRVIALPELRLDGDGVDRAPVANALTEIVQGKIAEGKAALLAVSEAQLSSRASSTAPVMNLRLQLLPGAEFRQVMVALSGLAEGAGAPAAATPFIVLGVASPE